MTSTGKKWLWGSAIGVGLIAIWQMVTKDRVRPPALPPEGGEASRDTPRRVTFSPPTIPANAHPFRTPILFGHDSVRVHRNYHGVLGTLGEILTGTYRNRSVLLTGYASRSGSDSYNQRLSLRRAQAIAELIVTQHPGVRPDQLVIRAEGESNPKATPAQSRRVEVSPR